MARLLLVSREPQWALRLAARWVRDAPTQVVLLDAAAGAARQAHEAAATVSDAVAAGVLVAAHDAAALRRGIGPADLVDGVKTLDLDEVADLVVETSGTVMWL